MSKIIFAATASVCVLAAAAKAWLGRGSGLFALVLPFGLFSVLFPYFAPALLSWGFRRRPIVLGILLALSVLASGYGLSFFYNDWYWPRPTDPSPWREIVIMVVAVPRWLIVGVAALLLLACRLHSRYQGLPYARRAGLHPGEP